MRLSRFSFLLSLVLAGYGQTAKELFQKAQKSEKPTEQIQLLSQALQLEKRNEYYFYRGWAYVDLDRYGDALSDFFRGLETPGELTKASFYGSISYVHYLLGNYEEAQRFATNAIQESPNYFFAYKWRGWSAYEQKRYQQALTDFQKVIQLSPSDPDPYYGIALIYEAQGNFSQALSYLEKAIERARDPKRYLSRKVAILHKMGRKKEALQLARSLIQIGESEDPNAYIQIGNLFYNAGEYATAIEYYQHAKSLFEEKVKRDPQFRYTNQNDLFEIYYFIGQAYYSLQKYQDALAYYTRATTVNPNDQRGWLALGNLQVFQENWKEAINAYEKAYRLNPKTFTEWINYGFALSELNRHREAIKVYTEGIQFAPEEGLLYNNRGFAYLELKEYDKAYQDLQKAIQVDPEIPMSHISLGEYFIEVGKYEEAIRKFDEALAMPNCNRRELGVGYYKRGMAYFYLNRLEEAVRDLRKALTYLPDWPEIHLLLGKAYFEKKDLCLAKQSFHEALKWDHERRTEKAKEAVQYLAKITSLDSTPCD
jgi:tetratricopeptide (TPR) repeat protein